MECVRNQDESDALSPSQIFKRLGKFIDEMSQSVDRLPNEFVEQLPPTPLSAVKLLHANVKTLTREEYKSIDCYLTSSLKIIKGMLQKKKEPSLDSLFTIGAAHDIFSIASYKRRYQKALILWMWGREQVEAVCRPIPSQLADREINLQVARALYGKFEDDSLDDIPKMLESVIQQAQAADDESWVNKATALLSLIEGANRTHEQEWRSVNAEQDAKWKAMNAQERFLTEVAKHLKGKKYKAVVNPDHIQLIPNSDYDIPMSSLEEVVYVYAKIEAEKFGMNTTEMELCPQTSTTPEGYIRIDFVPKIKQ